MGLTQSIIQDKESFIRWLTQDSPLQESTTVIKSREFDEEDWEWADLFGEEEDNGSRVSVPIEGNHGRNRAYCLAP